VQEAGRLLISPDGPLWEVPFAALVTNAAGPPRYLGLEKPITYTQSLTLFAQSRRDQTRQTRGGAVSALVLGSPLFHRGPPPLPSPHGSVADRTPAFLALMGRPPSPLPATQQEATEIAALYGSESLLQEHATEAALRQRIATADIVHLATHGFLHPARAMSSGILLTPGEARDTVTAEAHSPGRDAATRATDDDGILQAWEIYSQLNLKAELVVLSACETGRGENVWGEGIVGLTRAFQYAGARSVLATQWQVSDASSGRLMVAFHRGLQAGIDKDDALRRAMETVRQNPATSHPYHWSAFFLTGDPTRPSLAAP
jgi:CHAT domain-containing protein